MFFLGLNQVGSSLIIFNLTIFIGLIIKLGLAPFFIYKIELYKGLPFFTLALYSIVYFTAFGTAFVTLYTYYFSLSLSILRMLILIFLVPIIFIVVLIFDSQHLRNFFAISSILTSTNIFLAVIG